MSANAGVVGVLTRTEVDAIRKNKTLDIAMSSAVQYGLGTGAMVGAGVVAATALSPRFKKFSQISIKVGIPVMASMFAFCLKFELTTSHLKRNPKLVPVDEAEVAANKREVQASVKNGTYNMPIAHKMGNFLYDHPFAMIVGFGLPFAGYIFSRQLKYKHLTTSQKVMQSRVIAQGGILTVAMSTMAFQGYMDKRGRFPDPSEGTRVQRLQKQ